MYQVDSVSPHPKKLNRTASSLQWYAGTAAPEREIALPQHLITTCLAGSSMADLPVTSALYIAMPEYSAHF
jgi:hypothetical protein